MRLPDGFGSWGSPISFCTCCTWTFECEGDSRRPAVQKAMYREFVAYMLHFEYRPEPVFETKLIFSPRFVDLSSQGLFLNVKIRACATGPYPGSILDGLGHVTFPGHFRLPCLPWQVCLKYKILPTYQSPQWKLWPVGSMQQGCLHVSVDFYS